MYSRFKQTIKELKDTGNYRFLRNTSSNGKYISYNGNDYINFSSNDYLGISGNVELWQNFLSENKANNKFTASSCSSRLLSGNNNYYFELESYLAKAYNSEAALVFNSGYHANIGILPAISTKNDLILADKLVHASIIDGLKLCNAKVVRYKHNDYSQIINLLENNRHKYDHVIIVTESVFSMEGSLCNINKLVEIKRKFNTLLYIDEAHAIGTLGNTGLGLCQQLNLINNIDFIVGTFGKAVASQGAYVICNNIIAEFLINTMRSFIFTTALPPISLQWTLFSLKAIANMSAQRNYLNNISTAMRNEIMGINLETRGNTCIIPVIISNSNNCVQTALELQEGGIYVLPVRPPTVPNNTARLRFSLTATINYNDINKAIDLLKKCKHAIQLYN